MHECVFVLCAFVDACARVRARVRVRVCLCMCACARAHSRACVCACVRVCVCACARACSCAYACACAHVLVCVRVRVRVHVRVNVRVCACVCACASVHKKMYVHTCNKQLCVTHYVRIVSQMAVLQITNTTLTELHVTNADDRVMARLAGTLAGAHSAPLQALALNETHLSDTGADVLAGMLMANTRLRTLTLCGVTFTGTQDGVIEGDAKLALAFMVNSTLTQLNLTGLQGAFTPHGGLSYFEGMQLESFSAYPGVIIDRRKLRTLYHYTSRPPSLSLCLCEMRDVQIGDTICDMMYLNPSLCSLDLMFLGPMSETNYRSVLVFGTPATVTSLQLRSVLSKATCEALIARRPPVIDSETGTTIDLIQSAVPISIADNLRHLSITCEDLISGVRQYDADSLVDLVLPQCTNLCSLKILGMADVGIAKLARALQTQTFLTRLSTLALTAAAHGHRALEDQGAIELAQALSKGDISLTELDLSNHRVGFAGARALSDSLVSNTTVTSLNMSVIFDVSFDGISRALTQKQITECKEVFERFTHYEMQQLPGHNNSPDVLALPTTNSGDGIWLSHLVDVIKELDEQLQLAIFGGYALPPSFNIANGLLAEFGSPGFIVGWERFIKMIDNKAQQQAAGTALEGLANNLARNTTLTHLDVTGLRIRKKALDMIKDTLGSNTVLVSLALGAHINPVNNKTSPYLVLWEQAAVALNVAGVFRSWPRAGVFALKHISLYRYMGKNEFLPPLIMGGTLFRPTRDCGWDLESWLFPHSLEAACRRCCAHWECIHGVEWESLTTETEQRAVHEAQNKLIVAYFHAQLDCVKHFSLGLHYRLGEASPVLLLSDDGPFRIIVEMVLDRSNSLYRRSKENTHFGQET